MQPPGPRTVTTDGQGLRPADPGFTPSNPRLRLEAVEKVPVDGNFDCPECRERRWQPRVWQEDCPECYGDDPYGQGVYCAECEYCCGC